MKVKALKFTKKNHGFHRNKRFSWKKVNFTENVTAVKSWIRSFPTDIVCLCLQDVVACKSLPLPGYHVCSIGHQSTTAGTGDADTTIFKVFHPTQTSDVHYFLADTVTRMKKYVCFWFHNTVMVACTCLELEHYTVMFCTFCIKSIYLNVYQPTYFKLVTSYTMWLYPK